MRELGTNQKLVAEAAKRQLKSKPWFEKIVLDGFPTEQECIDDHEGCVQQVAMNTAHWCA